MSIYSRNGLSPASEGKSSFTAPNVHAHAHTHTNNNHSETPNDNLNGYTHQRQASGSVGNTRITSRVSSTASHQHQQEQELLSGFTVPEPPISTKESTLAAGGDIDKDSMSPEAPRTLWMGDLDPWLDEHAIIGLWWQILGLEVSVKLIRPRHQRESGFAHSGYCFVEFPSFQAAQQALGLNGQLLPDVAIPSQQHFGESPDNQKKYFRLNWASGATLSAPLVESPEFSLFVGDLSASTTEAHLLSFFQKQFPNSIRTVRVMTDPVSGKSRCFGFVRFTQESERQRALVEMNGVWFGGRPLRVATATPRSGPQQRNGIHTRDPYGFIPDQQVQESNNFQSPIQGYYQSPMTGNVIPHSQMSHGTNLEYVDPSNTTVFIGGLSADVSDQTLYTLFKPFGIILQIKLPPGKNCGFVKYSTREEAEAAIANMEGFVIGGHRVRLGWGRLAAGNKRLYRQQLAQMQMQAMSLGYDPSSVYVSPFPPSSGHMFSPMGVQMRPPGMYHYMENPGSQMFEGDNVSDYASVVDDHPPLVRSRSLDNAIEGSGSTGSLGPSVSRSYLHDQLANTFDTLTLDATSQFSSNDGASQADYVPYHVYSQSIMSQTKHSYSDTNLTTKERSGSAISSGGNGKEKGSGADFIKKAPDVKKESEKPEKTTK